MAVKAFCNINTGHRAAEALIRCYPPSASSTRTTTIEFDAKDWIYQALTVGLHFSLYKDKLGLPLMERFVATSIEHVANWIANPEL